jgi:hypothetical protein
MGESRFVYRNLVEEPEGKTRFSWEDNNKIDIQEVGCRAWTGLIWLRKGTGGGHL